MSIEEQLKQEFTYKAEQIEMPEELVKHVGQHIEQHLQQERNVGSKYSIPPRKRSFLRPVPIIAALCLAVLLCSGLVWAYEKSKVYHFKAQSELITVSYTNSEDYSISEEQKARLKQVQDQLEPGEAAIVYIPELERVIDLMYNPDANKGTKSTMHYSPYTKVNQLIYYTDLSAWLAALGPEYEGLKIPTKLPKGYQLESGTIEHEFYGSWGEDELKAIKQLDQKEDLTDYDWIKLDQQAFTPNLIYKNKHNETIKVSFSFIETIRRLEMTLHVSTQAEAIEINGQEALYTVRQSQEHGTNKANSYRQSIQWYERKKEGEKPFFGYHISSDSKKISFKDLIQMAEAMQSVEYVAE